MKYSILLIICLLSFTCFAKKKINSKSLTGNYSLVKQKDRFKLVPVNISKSKITIDLKENKIKCYVGCNSISGNFYVEKNQIEPLQLVSTEMLCPGTKSAQERTFLRNMSSINNYKFYKNFLYLLDEKEILIVLKRK